MGHHGEDHAARPITRVKGCAGKKRKLSRNSRESISLILSCIHTFAPGFISSAGVNAVIKTLRSMQALPRPLVDLQVGDERGQVHVSFDGREFTWVSTDTEGIRFRLPSGRPLGSLGLRSALGSHVSSDGRWFVEGRSDGKLTIRDSKTFEEVVQTSECHGGLVTTVAISPDTSKIASGAIDGSLMLWSLATGERLAGPLNLGSSDVYSLRFSPTGDRLGGCLRAGDDGASFIWDVSSNQLTQVLRVKLEWPQRFHWSDDGRQAFSGSNTSMVVIETSTLLTRQYSIGYTNLAINSKFIVAFTPDVGARFVDAATHVDISPTLSCWPISFSPDHTLFLSCPLRGYGSPISIWRLRDIIPKYYTICPLINISNVALVAWYEGKLTDAEAILSAEISTHSHTSHDAYANRALVQARLGDWNASLEDARTSIRIQPTTIGRVAEAIALGGQGNHSAARQAIDLALHDDSWYERELVLLIKAIILFKAGLHDEAIKRVIELKGIAFDKRMPKFAEAYMHLIHGKRAMENKKYDMAIKSFKNAQDLGPFGKVPRLDTVFLLFGWDYDPFWFTIHQRKCEALLAAHRTNDATDCLKEISNEFADELMAEKDKADWFAAAKRLCSKTSEELGNTAMQAKQYDEAMQHYTVALDHEPPNRDVLLNKRSKVQSATQSWEGARKDAEEAIELNPSSPWGHMSKHAALHGQGLYDEARSTLADVHAKIDESVDPKIRQKRENFARSPETSAAIDRVRQEIFKKSPFVLIDVATGRLCDAKTRQSIFENDPTYKELVSSMRAKNERIQTTVEEFFEYVMFSHKWDEQHREPSFQDVSGKSIWDLPPSPTIEKLWKFLEMVRKAGFRWAWSDTCCIDKTDPFVLSESIISMYKWYEESALTLAFLASISSPSRRGDLKGCLWMLRGWTLQELLGPKAIRFYDSSWNPYLNDLSPNHKESSVIMQDSLAEVTHVDPATLIDFRPSALGVREKLRLASTRVTTKEEDIAYCLIGIFSSDLAPKYGEGKNALGRLLQEVVGRLGEVTVLAWTGKSSTFNTCLPADIAVYQQSPPIPSIPADQMEKQVAKLRSTVSKDLAASIYDKIVKLGPPRFIDRRLSLPCIQFPVSDLSMKTFSLKTVTRKLGGTETAYTAKVSGIGTVTITTADPLPMKPLGKLLLVHPWIRELLDPVGGDDDWDDLEPEDEAEFAPVPSAPSYSYDHALRVIARLGQRFSALLLQRASHHEYQRVAADNEIIVQLPQTVSSKDIRVGVVDIL